MQVESVVEAKLVIRFSLPGTAVRSSSGDGHDRQLQHAGGENWVLELKRDNWAETVQVLRELAGKIESVGGSL